MNCLPTIGLEVHVQLSTVSKLFCGCSTAFGAPPNTHTCPVCLGLPGSLPVTNREAVVRAMLVGRALNCTVQRVSVFHRKHYFYPDLPKNYQISQYDRPIATDGWLEYRAPSGLRRTGIRRAHLEEDAGKLMHAEQKTSSLVDLNRTGTPLVEIVTDHTRHPMHAPADAIAFLTALHATLRYLGVSDCNMEEGSLRCDANVSVSRDPGAYGTKTEIKNLNSFKAVERALLYEISRQEESLASGERIVQETRLWDDRAGVTRAMRSKEESHDYRYMPEPDLPPLVLTDAMYAEAEARMPELPLARLQRFLSQYALPEYDAEVLTAERSLADYYEAVVAGGASPKAASNWVKDELQGLLHSHAETVTTTRITSSRLAELIMLVEKGALSGKAGKDVLAMMRTEDGGAAELVARHGLAQVNDEDALARAVDEAIAAHPKPVADYRAGKKAAGGFLVGQVMKATRGKANPTLVQEVLARRLGSTQEAN